MVNRLLRTVEPYKDEAPHGYYRRLAQENRLSSWKDLARAVGGSPAATHLFSHPESTAKKLCIDSHWTGELAKRDNALRALQRFKRRSHDAVCPTCLKDAPYLRVSWAHTYVTACPVHQCNLIDTCDQCMQPLSDRRHGIEFCGSCGRDLRAISTSTAKTSALWLAETLGGFKQKAVLLSPEWKMHDALALSLRIQTLCELFNPLMVAPRRNSASPQSIAQTLEFLQPLDEILSNWPTGFRAHVSSRLRVASPSARTLNAALGLWYTRLKRHSLQEAQEPFLTEVIHVTREIAPILLGLDGALSVPTDGPRYFNLRDAAHRLSIRRDSIAAAIEKGEVLASTRSFGTRRLMYQIPEAEVLRLESARSNWIDEISALDMLDVPPAVLAGLKDAKVITHDARWRSNVFKLGPIERQSIAELLNGIRDYVDPKSAHGDSLELREISGRRVRDKQELRSLYQAIVSGEVRGVGRLPAKGIGQIRFLRDDVTRYIGNPVVEAGLTIERLASLTGWKYESIAYWIGQGLLGCREITLRGQKCHVVMPEQLVAFSRAFIPLADAAKAIGTTASALSKRMPSIQPVGAKPVSGSTGRGGLIPISQLVFSALKGDSS